MKSVFVSLLLLCATAQAQSLSVPTALAIDPALAGCSNIGTAHANITLTVLSNDGVSIEGYANLKSFGCTYAVKSGRGGALRVFSACAEVTWDLQGNVLNVTPVSNAPAYSITCD